VTEFLDAGIRLTPAKGKHLAFSEFLNALTLQWNRDQAAPRPFEMDYDLISADPGEEE
jgi:hypothetical protein